MNWLQDVLALLQLAPQVLQLIIAVEGIFGPGGGATKKAVVMGALATAPASVLPHASTFIDNTVSALNTAGKFVKAVAA